MTTSQTYLWAYSPTSQGKSGEKRNKKGGFIALEIPSGFGAPGMFGTPSVLVFTSGFDFMKDIRNILHKYVPNDFPKKSMASSRVGELIRGKRAFSGGWSAIKVENNQHKEELIGLFSTMCENIFEETPE
jgi:hypothetical protein